MSGEFAETVCEIVRRVPEGSVVTYGQVAAMAGWPRRPRHVGNVMAGLPDATDVPWHRVLNAQGEVSKRSDGSGIPEGFQRHLLEEEGVEFDTNGKVDLDRFRWEPTVRIARP